jgi:hypothetical protein
VAPFSPSGGTGTPFCRSTGSAASEAERSDKPCATRAKKNATSRGRRRITESRLMEEEARHRHEDHHRRRREQEEENKPLTEQVKEVVGVK